jgi:predicted dehydrogenase
MLTGALIGYGFIAENGHFPAYRAALASGVPVSIVAVADVCPARLAKVKAAYPEIRVYEDARRLFDAEKDLDFVDISTPPSEHAAIAHEAFDRGLHVFCEKPMATTAKDAASMLAHARRAKRVLFPSHNYKHAPVIRAVRQAIDEGTVGNVHLVTLHTFRNTHAKGVPEWRPNWRRERRYSGGGIAMDHGAHTFYLAFDWLGAFPTSITARMQTLGNYDTEDDLSCTLTFPRGGVATAHLTWNAGIRRVIYTVHGDRGAIRVEDDDVEVASMRIGDDGRTTWDLKKERIASDWMDASHVHWFRSVFEQFAAAIDKGDYVSRETLQGFRCVELIETAYESARQGSRELSLGEPARKGARDLILHPD